MTMRLTEMPPGADPKAWEGWYRGAPCPLGLSGEPGAIVAELGESDEP
jgi:hypothetical protein